MQALRLEAAGLEFSRQAREGSSGGTQSGAGGRRLFGIAVILLLALALATVTVSGAGLWVLLTDPARAVRALDQRELSPIVSVLLDLARRLWQWLAAFA
jgi:hypothetical protein